MLRAGQQGVRECGGEGLTCQQQQQLPQAVLVQVQGVLLPTSFLLLQPQRHQSFRVMISIPPCPTWTPPTGYKPWPQQLKPLPEQPGGVACPEPSLG